MLASLLDNDLYKFTMQQAVLELYPDIEVEYRFTNRRPSDTFTQAFFDRLHEEIQRMRELELSLEELHWVERTCPFFKPQYLGYLRSYRYDPDEVLLSLNDGHLDLRLIGPWHRTILWEVPLMALISETCFEVDRPEWNDDGQSELARSKAQRLAEADCRWAEFGTRRRRSYRAQETVLEQHRDFKPNFVGTSNMHFAHRFGLKPIGTMAHDWIMALSVLEGLRHANRHALKAWHQVYRGSLGIALTDTFGTDAFFEDFDAVLTRQFDGVRHDSGDPFAFLEKTLKHYQSLQVPASTKTIIFTDGLNVDKAIQLREMCADRIRSSFGIGTHFTNDYAGSPALNIVLKLWSINGFPVVKLSDDEGKAQGDADAIRVARWTFFGTPLD